MFNKIFTPKLQHPDPDKRLAAIKTLTGSDQDLVLLGQLALNDADSGVRDQALSHLCAVISDETDIDATTAMKLFKIAEFPMKEKIISHVRDEKCLDQCIDNADSQRDLMLLAVKSALPAARKKAAEKITGLDNLKQLQSQVKDKNVLQVARQKINLIKAQQKARDAANNTLDQICEALERLSKSEFEPMLVSRVSLLESHWEEVDEQYKADFQSRYDQANNLCHQKISAAQEQQALAEFESSQNEICRSLCADYERVISVLSFDTADRWPELKDKIEQQWASCGNNFSPRVEISERYYTLRAAAGKIEIIIDACKNENLDVELEVLSDMDIEALGIHERRLFKLTTQLSWSYKFKQPQLFQQIKKIHGQVKNLLQEKQNKQKKKLAQIDARITVLKSHIRAKNLIKANRLLNYIQTLIEELPETLQLHEHDKMRPVIISLNELRGLNEFITQPKKLELCEQMEALIDKEIKPEKLIGEIKNIQIKWKSLATSDAESDDVLWERFKQAADRAYLPCAAYLKDLELLKNKNLAARAALNERLGRQLDEQDWDNVDWKQVQESYSQYWRQWRSLTPVFYSQNKQHQKKFEALIAVIKNRLDNEKNENHLIYDQLIDRVSQLAESLNDDNVEDAIQQVKRIQGSWKNVGVTHFNKSRKQWKKFQKKCDQVFEYQRQKHKSKLQQENQQLDQVHALINKIKALTRLPDEQFAASQDDYQALVENFELMNDLPASLQDKIQRMFDRSCEDYQSNMAGLGKRNKLRLHKMIRQAAQLCCAAESLAQGGANRAEIEKIKSEYESLAIENALAERLTQRIDTALAIADNAANLDQDQCDKNENRLSELAVKLEVLFDLETPDYALKQRMEYQLEQLQSGIRPALSIEEKQNKLVELELDWYRIGAVSVDTRKRLEQRLDAVIKQVKT